MMRPWLFLFDLGRPFGFARVQMAWRQALVIALVVALAGAMPHRASAQGVHPDVLLTRPTAELANTLGWMTEARTPPVGVLAPARSTDSTLAASRQVADRAVRGWEYLLLGFDIPYRILEDSSLTDAALSGMRLLVLPASESLSPAHRNAVKRFMERGGGVIASGPTGTQTAPGAPADDAFMQEVFGLRLAGVLPDTINGVDVTLRGGHRVTAGMPDGYRFNVGRAPGVTLAVPIRGESLGTTQNYAGKLLADDPTLLAHGRYGNGGFLWLGFTGLDVARDAESQRIFQGLIVNAIACLTETPAVALRAWPNGARSAFALAVLPEVGHQPFQFLTVMDVLLEALQTEQAPATFFLTTDETIYYPQMVARMAASGELALSADNDDLLAGQPAPLQRHRLEMAVDAFQKQTGSRPAGFYPPDGLLDVETLKAAHNLGFAYVLDAAPVRRVPTYIRWDLELDYKDSLLVSNALARPMLRMHPNELTHPSYWSNQSSANAMIVRMASALKGDLDRVDASGGLFLYGFQPGIQALTQRRADVVEALARHARMRGSWMATLGEIDAWWRQRSQLAVRMTPSRRGDGFEIEVDNAGASPVDGVGLTLMVYDRTGEMLDIDGATWRLDEATRDLQILIDRVPPGVTTLRVRMAPTVLSSSAGR
jgi:Polysaccharide deacetylase